MIAIRKYMAPLSATSGRGNTRKYITIHETANRGRGANANAHARLQAGGNSRQASWHYQVDDKEIVQSFDDNVKCWHAGGTANSQSIAIEICVNSDGNYAKAVANAAKLVAFLRKKHGISANRVVSHNFWTGKNCPAIMLGSKGAWAKFIKDSAPGAKTTTTPTTPKAPSLETAVNKVMETNQANVRVYKSNSLRSAVIGTMSGAGYDIHVVKTQGASRSWAQIKWKGGLGWVEAKRLRNIPASAAKAPAKRPAAARPGEWPASLLKVDGKFHLVTKRGYQRLLAPKGVGDYQGTIDGDFGSRSVKAEQRWLKRLGYYKGLIDGIRGPLTIRALQNFLSAKGFYRGLIDGRFQTLSIKGLQQYMNGQRRHY